MSRTIVVFDLETVPDLAAVARVHGLDPADTQGARDKLGTGFPKLLYHAIVCIGALVAERADGAYRVRALGAPNAGERGEARLIADFAASLDRLRPQLVSFNGHGFDLPVLRYRALVNGIAAPGLTCRPYYRRYDEAALDLCDVLGNFDARAKVGLDALCRALGLPGKPDGVDGAGVADLVAAGRFDEVSAYCVSDVVATFRLFLAYERMCGTLDADIRAHDAALVANWNAQVGPRDEVWHLGDLALGLDPEALARLFARLHGRKHLLVGNHDGKATLRLPWSSPPRQMHEIVVEGQRVVLCHYALRSWRRIHSGAVHLYGHTHNSIPGTRHSEDVGVDAWDYAPVRLPDLIARMAGNDRIEDELVLAATRVEREASGRTTD